MNWRQTQPWYEAQILNYSLDLGQRVNLPEQPLLICEMELMIPLIKAVIKG